MFRLMNILVIWRPTILFLSLCATKSLDDGSVPHLGPEEVSHPHPDLFGCDIESKRIIEVDVKMLKSNQNLIIFPEIYELKYIFDDNLAKYDGEVSIEMTCVSRCNHVTVQSHSNDILLIKTQLKRQEKFKFPTLYIDSMCRNNDNILFKFSRYLEPGERFTLSIKFNGTTSYGMNGIYKSKYTSDDEGANREEFIVSTHFEPEQARSAFPCIDYPKVKAHFKLTLDYPSPYNAISNMPESTTTYGTRKTSVFESSPKMSTYLLAFTISKYHFIEGAANGSVKVRVFLPKSLLKDGKYALDTTLKVLPMFEKLYDLKYPLPKLDLIGIPNFEAGAMENWGLITFRMSYLLYNEDKTTLYMLQQVTETILHEIAHQWFGNLVTMRWWNDIWLNEGFATFMQYYMTGKMYPEWKMDTQLSAVNTQTAMHYDVLPTSHAIALPLGQVEEPGVLFDSVAYLKSCSIISMIAGNLGENTLNERIRLYLKTYLYGTATSDDLWNTLSVNNSDVQFSKMMSSWIYQTGFPLINVTRMGETSTFVITQQRFVVSRNAHLDEPSVWWIPLSYVVKHTDGSQLSSGVYWLNQPRDVLVFKRNVEWIKFNHQASGFYRVMYDNRNFEGLLGAINETSKALGEPDILNLLQDAFSFLWKNITTISQIFDFMDKVRYSRDYFIISEIVSIYTYIDDALKYEDIVYFSYREKMKLHMEELYKNCLNNPESLNHLSTRYKTLMKYMLVAGCIRFNCSFVVEKYLRIYETWILNREKLLPEELEIMLLTASMYGSETMWNHMMPLYMNETDPSMKNKFLYSLPNINDTDYLEIMLQLSLHSEFIATQNAAYFVGAICQKRIMRKIGWKFMKENWEKFVEIYSTDKSMLSHLVKALQGRISSEQELQEFKEFFEPKREQFYAQEFNEAIEAAANRLDWLRTNLPGIKKYLKIA